MGCFFASGVHATKMSDVARAAKMAKGTVYLYFESKEDLLAALLLRHFEGLRAEIEAAPMPPTLVALIDGIRQALGPRETGASTLLFEALGPGFTDPRARHAITGFLAWLGGYYSGALQRIGPEGGVRPDLDADAAGAALAAMLDGLVIHAALTESPPEEVTARAEAALLMLERGLSAAAVPDR